MSARFEVPRREMYTQAFWDRLELVAVLAGWDPRVCDLGVLPESPLANTYVPRERPDEVIAEVMVLRDEQCHVPDCGASVTGYRPVSADAIQWWKFEPCGHDITTPIPEVTP